jgi:hypothetical protein
MPTERAAPQARGRNPDDWYCPKCYDLQFKGNAQCRICGLAREDGVQELSQLDAFKFLDGHDIEERVRQQFENLPPELQQAVMAGGSMHGARDPTAVLINRMSKAQCPRDGDWFCQKCGDHQFAKNTECRHCGAPKATDGTAHAPPDAETFLSSHPIDESAREEFFALDPAAQTVIICRGSLNGARDPTAVLLSRIKDYKRDGGFSKGKSASKGHGTMYPSSGKMGCKGMPMDMGYDYGYDDPYGYGKDMGYGYGMGKGPWGFGMGMMGPKGGGCYGWDPFKGGMVMCKGAPYGAYGPYGYKRCKGGKMMRY